MLKPDNIKLQIIIKTFHSRSADCHIVYLDGPPVYSKTGPVFGAAWNIHLQDARPMAQARFYIRI